MDGRGAAGLASVSEANFIVATEQWMRKILDSTEHIEIDFFIMMMKTWLLLCQPWKAAVASGLYTSQ